MGAASSSELIDSVGALQRDADVDEAHLERVLPATALPAVDTFAVLQPDVVRDLLRDRPRNLARLVLKVSGAAARRGAARRGALRPPPAALPPRPAFSRSPAVAHPPSH